LAPDCYYLPGAVNCGVIAAPEGKAVLVDTGLDDDSARRLLRACRSADLEPAAVVTTHHHADHAGGNAFLAERLGLPVFAPALEAALLANPLLEPMYLFAGATAPPALATKFFAARPSVVAPENVLAPGEREVAGVKLAIVPLGGHAPGMIGVGRNGVLYAADAVFGPAVLARHGLPFTSDATAQLAAIERVRDGGWDLVLPAHGEPAPAPDVAALCDANRAAVTRGLDMALAATRVPSDTETVVAVVSQSLGLRLETLGLYALIRTTVMAYLSHWLAAGRVAYALSGNRLLWRAA
jgi:glyoxylase-like metal-dependent hydrolase (beta-lactamase superfamily II)